jgi:hypothetical protein
MSAADPPIQILGTITHFKHSGKNEDPPIQDGGP